MVASEQVEALNQQLIEKRRAAKRLRQWKWRRRLKKRKLKRIAILIDCDLLQELDIYAESAGISRSEALNTCLGGAFTQGDQITYKNWLKRGKQQTFLKGLALILDKSIEKEATVLRTALNE